LMIGYVGPEAAAGGPLALVQNGDLIHIDAQAATMQLDVGEVELKQRQANWKPRVTPHARGGALEKYAKLVGPAYAGAVTHSGGLPTP
jgi:dihydroxy-acid dehydratase